MASDTDRIVELFKQEVPEVASGGVELKAVARKPGVRAKVAVQRTAENLDCISTCVGTRGIRMNRIVNALNQDRWKHPAVEATSIEQIDLFEWTQDLALLIRRALMPYRVGELNLNEDRTRATVGVIESESAMRSTGNLADHVELASESAVVKSSLYSRVIPAVGRTSLCPKQGPKSRSRRLPSRQLFDALSKGEAKGKR